MLCHSAEGVKKYHLDHLFPITWWRDWNDKKYTKKDVIDILNTIENENFKYYSKDELIAEINREDVKFELERNKKEIQID